MNILFSWEMGSNLGHITQISLIAQRFLRDGHRVSIAASDLYHTVEFFDKNVILCQAPIWHLKVQGVSSITSNYSQILLHQGYLSETGLKGLISAWKSIFDLAKPDLLVSESSPTSLLAAKFFGIKTARIGTGFSIPPAKDHHFPFLTHTNDKYKNDIENLDARILSTINAVSTSFTVSSFSKITDIVRSDRDFVMSYPQLDPYRDHRTDSDYFPPLFITNLNHKAQWPRKSQHYIYIYLRQAFSGCAALLTAITRGDYSAIAYLPDADHTLMNEFNHGNISITRKPINLDSIANQCNLAISYAGHGMASFFLSKGTYQLVCPQNLEQLITAKLLESLGAAQIIAQAGDAERYSLILAKQLSCVETNSALRRETTRQVTSINGQEAADAVYSELASLV